MVAVLVVAAGRGQRAGAGLPKQYRLCGGMTVLARSLLPFLAHPEIGSVTVVIHPDDRLVYDQAVRDLDMARSSRLMPPAIGGDTRQASVCAGLQALSERAPKLVLVHDAARPFCTPELISRSIEAGWKSGAAIPAVPVTDTIKQVSAQGIVIGTPDRASLFAVQTPQAYDFKSLLSAHLKARSDNLSQFTDDAALIEWTGQSVMTFAGDIQNVKLTHEADFAAAEQRLAGTMITHVGTGYDVHAFNDGDHVWLCGVKLPHDRGVAAHSDGDVAFHALTDALLGTIADGDIGTHFPPFDPQWGGASSDRFLAYGVDRLRQRGGIIDHLDLTIVCESPKIGPYRDAMQARIAAICGVDQSSVGLKATTSERMGFTGRKEGLAALATVTVRLPANRA
jgi:2-C-methyl-D-erythritol 4-phosphate cytidylyltransferase / 2-C-methyl-D-erythritol 2,4-cyclodiphosphate synthase